MRWWHRSSIFTSIGRGGAWACRLWTGCGRMPVGMVAVAPSSKADCRRSRIRRPDSSGRVDQAGRTPHHAETLTADAVVQVPGRKALAWPVAPGDVSLRVGLVPRPTLPFENRGHGNEFVRSGSAAAQKPGYGEAGVPRAVRAGYRRGTHWHGLAL